MALRALARVRRAAAPAAPGAPLELAEGRVDSWLEHFHGERLARLDEACAKPSPGSFGLFRELDADLWGLLLTQQYELYPNIRALLPGVPDPAIQALYNGTSGIPLAAQSVAFYRRLRERVEQHGRGPLERARLLDFGCGWGRLTRFLARDLAPGDLYGCDPVEDILRVCRDTRVPARLARSEFLPERLPFGESFDVVFAFSVFTHLSETAHLSCLHALHAGMQPGGILVVTVRPPQYLELSELMRPLLADLGTGLSSTLSEPRYLFVPHAAESSHPQYAGREMHFGEAVITLAYVRERWAKLFELLDVDLLLEDPYQVMLTLRRR